jgi:hypothetical protein
MSALTEISFSMACSIFDQIFIVMELVGGHYWRCPNLREPLTYKVTIGEENCFKGLLQ